MMVMPQDDEYALLNTSSKNLLFSSHIGRHELLQSDYVENDFPTNDIRAMLQVRVYGTR